MRFQKIAKEGAEDLDKRLGGATNKLKNENGKVPEVVTTTQAPAIIPTSTSTSVAMASSGNQINDG